MTRFYHCAISIDDFVLKPRPQNRGYERHEPEGNLMNEVASAAIERAKKEVQKENIDRAVDELKVKYRELERAKTVVANIERELKELELRISQGNLPDKG